MARRSKARPRQPGAAPEPANVTTPPAPWPGPRWAVWLIAIGAGCHDAAPHLSVPVAGRARGFATLIGDGQVYNDWAVADRRRRLAGHRTCSTNRRSIPISWRCCSRCSAITSWPCASCRPRSAPRPVCCLAMAGRRFFSAAHWPGGRRRCWRCTRSAIFFDGLIQKSVLDLFLVTLMLACVGEFQHRPRFEVAGGRGPRHRRLHLES